MVFVLSGFAVDGVIAYDYFQMFSKERQVIQLRHIEKSTVHGPFNSGASDEMIKLVSNKRIKRLKRR